MSSDLPAGYWNVDTLFILIQPDTEAQWQQVAEGWAADEIYFIEGADAGRILGAYGVPQKILTVWWD